MSLDCFFLVEYRPHRWIPFPHLKGGHVTVDMTPEQYLQRIFGKLKRYGTCDEEMESPSLRDKTEEDFA